MYICKVDSIYNNYRILEEVGKGGFGRVFKVENLTNKKMYLIYNL